MIRVLVADDSALMRKLLKAMIEQAPDIRVVATARDGEDAVLKARALHPDVVTMDVNMPNMDGITALQIIDDEELAPVIMVSSLTQEDAATTFEALALGAFDCVGKPGGTISANLSRVSADVIAKIRAAAAPGAFARLKRAGATRTPDNRGTPPVEPVAVGPRRLARAVAVGISTGGPRTIVEVLPRLPADLDAAVFLVQHMPASFTASFANRLAGDCRLRVVEAEAGMVVSPGTVYVGRGGYHLTVHEGRGGEVLVRTPTTPKHIFMPSVDVMMASVLNAYGDRTIGIVMTGMGSDGAEGMVKIARAGGLTIAESEESAVVFGMPKQAILMGGASVVAPSWEIADHIVAAVHESV